MFHRVFLSPASLTKNDSTFNAINDDKNDFVFDFLWKSVKGVFSGVSQP
jgi:hypothetical protein